MIKYIIYTQKNCAFCKKAKELLDEAGEVYEERLLDNLPKIKRFREAGHKTVPQIFLHIGGYTELEEFLFPPDIEFDADLDLIEETRPSAKVLPFKGQIGSISGEKKDE
jgi:glutaredoxin|tara:strand:+ start:273 stop:599 length:327 start_codon:yes stop_codon:yes gene_type:complete